MDIKKRLEMLRRYAPENMWAILDDANTRIASLEAQLKEREDVYIIPKGAQFSQDAADEFWSVWNENGPTCKHGYYESTWMAIWAALKVNSPPIKEKD